jgi:5-methyltetrahydrofolate--homocysteine methyltransferase
MNFLDTLKERIIVFDGAMGTNLQVQNLSLDDFGGLRFEGCNENLLVTRPDAVEKVHAGFLDVGCDVIETNSFNGTPVDFDEYGIADQAYDMNVRAARLAKRIASDYSTKAKPRWVAGSMGPGRKLPTLGHISFTELRDAYSVQVRGLLDGGADLLIVETCQDVLQTKAALGRDLRALRRDTQTRSGDRASHDRNVRHDAQRHRDRRCLDRARTSFRST